MNHRPRKRFGQNFLRDPGVIDRIVHAVDPRPGQQLVEIGPGLGALTGPLLQAAGEMHAVELDRDLVPKLAERFGDRLHLHSADALKFDFGQLAGEGRLRVVGNLPYNISTPLIFHLLAQAEYVQDMHFMLQKEVVDRLAASPGGRDYGRLSVMVQQRCRVEHLFNVSPGAFHPPPKVHSAIVRLLPYETPPVPVAEPALFSRIVAKAFSQRRKTLRNTLKGELDAETIEACGIDPTRRAETLSVEEFGRLAAAAEQD
ncbi:16S rRNA (adenine(1518)-N(6)/adenine(1519)-N(6))-dimethyltransferase RsmA [Thiohalomonas denitrificans]|uniref:16S rRNA (adenine(1518)-N(6)/adenine(1519)-N(6))- dimethyltransferase RsmA n=1 Tax=Thiohalomonas denitrificans TaxID=415747 RepID=UPI0026F04977|nr:16S rRNA (adenine(1518)-N(6)/adenine(1519)-N(6))-dimethyltransferase RsmA [Thiohalomonas denitrificans]